MRSSLTCFPPPQGPELLLSLLSCLSSSSSSLRPASAPHCPRLSLHSQWLWLTLHAPVMVAASSPPRVVVGSSLAVVGRQRRPARPWRTALGGSGTLGQDLVEVSDLVAQLAAVLCQRGDAALGVALPAAQRCALQTCGDAQLDQNWAGKWKKGAGMVGKLV